MADDLCRAKPTGSDPTSSDTPLSETDAPQLQSTVSPTESRPSGDSPDDETWQRNVYVRNLPRGFGSAELVELCSPFGEIASAKVIVDVKTGHPRGFGFVLFAHAQQAAACIAALHDLELGDKRVIARIAERETRQPGAPTNRVAVRNLPGDVTDSSLRQFVDDAVATRDAIVTLRLMPDGRTHQIAWLHCASPELAAKIAVALTDCEGIGAAPRSRRRPVLARVLDSNAEFTRPPSPPPPLPTRSNGDSAGLGLANGKQRAPGPRQPPAPSAYGGPWPNVSVPVPAPHAPHSASPETTRMTPQPAYQQQQQQQQQQGLVPINVASLPGPPPVGSTLPPPINFVGGFQPAPPQPWPPAFPPPSVQQQHAIPPHAAFGAPPLQHLAGLHPLQQLPLQQQWQPVATQGPPLAFGYPTGLHPPPGAYHA